jgi:hypothetical protein
LQDVSLAKGIFKGISSAIAIALEFDIDLKYENKVIAAVQVTELQGIVITILPKVSFN